MGTNDISISSLNKVAFMPVGNNRNGLDLRLITDKKLLQTVFSELFDYDFNKTLDNTERIKIRNIIGTNVLTPKKLEELNSTLKDIKYLIDDLADKSDEKRKKAAYKLLVLGPIVKTPIRKTIISNNELVKRTMELVTKAALNNCQTKEIEMPDSARLISECTRQTDYAKWVLANIKPNK